MMDKTDWKLLKEIADLEKTPRAPTISASTARWTPVPPRPTSTLPPRPTESRASISGQAGHQEGVGASPSSSTPPASPSWSTTISSSARTATSTSWGLRHPQYRL